MIQQVGEHRVRPRLDLDGRRHVWPISARPAVHPVASLPQLDERFANRSPAHQTGFAATRSRRRFGFDLGTQHDGEAARKIIIVQDVAQRSSTTSTQRLLEAMPGLPPLNFMAP